MEITNVSTETKRTSVFNVKNILRALLLIGMVFVFCPSFLVSCSGQEIEVSVMTAVGGVSMYGETVSEPYPIMLICLLIPIAIFVLLFLKKNDKAMAGIITVLAVIDLGVWFKFRTEVEKIAEENYCTFETTGCYIANTIVWILIIILALVVVVSKVTLKDGLVSTVSKIDTQNMLSQMSETMNQMSYNISKIVNGENTGTNNIQSDNIMGFCQQCGAPIDAENIFCTSCGTPVPADMIEEWNNSKKIKVFCQQCGMELTGDANFCESCGTKVE